MIDKKKINIGFLLNDIARGGAAKSIYLLIKNLDKKKYAIYLYVSRISDQEFANDFMNHCCSLNEVSLPSVYSLGKHQRNTSNCKTILFHSLYKKKIKAFINIIAKHHIDLLHINTTLFAYLPPVIKKETKIKVVFHIREVIVKQKESTFKFVLKWINNFSDAIICISENEATPFEKSSKVKVIPNPFDFETINSKNTKDENNEKYIGMLGSFGPVKRADIFLKAIRKITYKNPWFPYKFAILGANERRPYWKLFAKLIIYQRWYDLYFYILIDYLKIRDKIIMLNDLPDIQLFFDKLLIYVRPSGHPWGRDIIEAMAYGVPVVANGTSDYYIKPNISGLLAKPGDAEDLANKIYYLACNEKLREKFAIKAKYQIKEQCDVFKHVANIENVYNN
jgi:glycosyltransferase involved in cell wall biosynthesis